MDDPTNNYVTAGITHTHTLSGSLEYYLPSLAFVKMEILYPGGKIFILTLSFALFYVLRRISEIEIIRYNYNKYI